MHRDGHCHEAVMWYVHHLPESMKRRCDEEKVTCASCHSAVYPTNWRWCSDGVKPLRRRHLYSVSESAKRRESSHMFPRRPALRFSSTDHSFVVCSVLRPCSIDLAPQDTQCLYACLQIKKSFVSLQKLSVSIQPELSWALASCHPSKSSFT